MELLVTDRLAALAHPKRLALFQLLMRRYPDAVPAGEISRSLSVKANTASTYLNRLRQARLIHQHRRGASLMYRADLAAMRELMGALSAGCCQNRPDLCAPFGDVPPVRPQETRPCRVLFVCSANAARSVIAECILNRLGQGRFVAQSAGAHPGDAPHLATLSLLQHKGYDVRAFTPRCLHQVVEQDTEGFDVVITLCDLAANESPPQWDFHPLQAHWSTPDPVMPDQAHETAFQHCYRGLEHRIRRFTDLPFERLSRSALQAELDRIALMNIGAYASVDE